MDQLERWRRFELSWDDAQFDSGLSPIKYWQDLRLKYPQLALYVLTIPASSCDCERMFSELGDLLEPRRRKISSSLLAAVQCVKAWRAAGYRPQCHAEVDAMLMDEVIDNIYKIREWDHSN